MRKVGRYKLILWRRGGLINSYNMAKLCFVRRKLGAQILSRPFLSLFLPHSLTLSLFPALLILSFGMCVCTSPKHVVTDKASLLALDRLLVGVELFLPLHVHELVVANDFPLP